MATLDDGTLMAFVDGELDADSAREVARALATDPEAEEKVRLLRLSAPLVRAALDQPAYQKVPPEIAAEVAGAPTWRARLAWNRRLGGAIAASLLALVIGAGGGWLLADRQPGATVFGERLMDEVADYHVLYAREDEHLVEVPATRREHIETWLGSRLHRELRIPDLSSHGFTFSGARMLVVDGRPVAQLIYVKPGDEHHPLALCVTFGMQADMPVRAETREGVNLAMWRAKGYVYVLVGWVPSSFLTELAGELRPRLRQG